MIVFVQENPLAGAILVLLWVGLLLYLLSACWWLLEAVVLARGWKTDATDIEWGFDDIQIRILTIDAEQVVQTTVNAVPDGIEDVRVIAEADLEIDGATVHVVPDDYDCTATNKGRAVEWARRRVYCDKEYVLYLDEDTLMAGFNGLPDADVIQFTEKPIYTGSRLSYLSEVFRIGYQFEQFGFHRLTYPLYAWGGGIAVRSSIEDDITWDVATITEDTNFLWRAADTRDLSYTLLNARFRNQAPPSLRAMIHQRRRWISGTMADGHILPRWYQPLYYTRIIAWAFSPLVVVLALVAAMFPGSIPTLEWYALLSIGLVGILFVYMIVGLIGYRKHPVIWPLLLALTPIAVAAHSIGALWGALSPVETFEVTEKVAPETIETVHSELEKGDLAEHEGTDRLVRDSENEFDMNANILDDD
ncbi:glycosyltransferase [Halostagnicola kamekurae]|uniref:Glycosyl transferase family group 2 n=1 Tax=Halostagnicola kamekurae TaxID=619731 RepID=A0A1I6SQF4_9EURY|nr:Glycosyl transferase family group 2 [Halostagnicola kamekurae]